MVNMVSLDTFLSTPLTMGLFDTHQTDLYPAVQQSGLNVNNDSTQELLSERATTHGDFGDNAKIGQSLRSLYRNQYGWGLLTEVQREALDVIAVKMSRILSGQGSFNDHWEDIAGYARLVVISNSK